MKYKIIYHDGKPSRYGINKNGDVKNLITNKSLKYSLNVNGYYIVRPSFEKYHRTECLVHRLLASAFIENDDPKNRTCVHHKDRNKLNNKLSNLMWVSEEEHKEIHKDDENHPFANGEKHSNAILKEKDVMEICQYIQDNAYTQHQLAVIYQVSDQVIHDIKNKQNWTHISKLYDFSKYDNKKMSRVDESIVRAICDDLVSNKYTTKSIAYRHNVSPEAVMRIRNKKTYKNIVCDYDFSKNTKNKPIIKYDTNPLHITIHRMMMSGMRNKDIMKKLDLPNTRRTESMMYRIRHVNKFEN